MLNDAMMGAKTPKALGGSPISLWVYVEDCDAFVQPRRSGRRQNKRRANGKNVGSVLGRSVRLAHGSGGYMWIIATHKEDLTPDEMKRRQDEWMKEFAAEPAHA